MVAINSSKIEKGIKSIISYGDEIRAKKFRCGGAGKRRHLVPKESYQKPTLKPLTARQEKRINKYREELKSAYAELSKLEDELSNPDIPKDIRKEVDEAIKRQNILIDSIRFKIQEAKTKIYGRQTLMTLA